MKKFSCILISFLAAATLGAQDLSLKDCIDIAERNSAGMKNARLDILAAESQLREARWEHYPQLSLNTLGYKAIDPMLKITLHDVLGNSDRANELNEELSARAWENGIKPYYTSFGDGWSIGLSALQPIYAGGRIRAGNRLAALGVESAKIQSRIALRSCCDSVESKYWRVVELQEKSKALDGALRLLDTLDKDLGSAVAAGLATEPDLMQLRLKRNELRAAKRKLGNGIKLLKMDLLSDIGYDYEFLKLDRIHLSEPLSDLPAPESVIVDESLYPALEESKLLALRTEAGQLEKRMSVGELLPQLAIGGGYGYGAMGSAKDGKFNGLVFASLQVPLTGIGKSVERSRRYDLNIQKYRNDQEHYEAKLLLQMRMLAVGIENAWDEVLTAEEAVGIAEDSVRRIRENYDAGRTTFAELLKAELDLLQASDELTAARAAYRIAINAYNGRIHIE